MPVDISDPSFQGSLVSLMIEDPTFLPNYRNSIQDQWFLDPSLKKMVTSILSYYDKYGKNPTYKEIFLYIKNFVARDKASVKEFKQLIQNLRVLGNGNLALISDSYENFAHYQTYRKMLWVVKDALEEGRIKDIPTIIRQCQIEISLPDDKLTFPDEVYEILSDPHTRTVIPTGIKNLDKYLAGGAGRQELSVVLGYPGLGKTAFLINMGAAALKRGYSVLHLFAEQTKEKIGMRYGMRLGRQNISAIKRDPKEATAKVMKGFSGDAFLHIVYCANWTVSDIRNYIYREYESKFPDMVIVDYADKLVPRRHYGELRHELGFIYDDLIRLAKKLDIVLWTASQTNKLGTGKFVGIEAVSESWNKVANADTMIFLQQTGDEKKKRELRLFIGKAREAQGNEHVHCIFTPDTMVIADVTSVKQARISKVP